MTMIGSLVFWGKCKKCGHEFKFPSDPGNYEMKLLTSIKTLRPVIVKCEDTFFKEVWMIVKEVLKEKMLSEVDMADKFDLIFGKLCDKAPDGSYYDMSGTVWCPICPKSDCSYGPTEPPEYVYIDPPEITHSEWDKMNQEEKEEKVRELLSEL